MRSFDIVSTAAAADAPMSRPARQSIARATTNTPASRTMLPRSWSTAVEANLVSASMSPSMRSMSKPGTVLTVPGEFQTECMSRQVTPKAVADPPCHADRQPRDQKLESVGRQRHEQEHRGDADENLGRLAMGGRIDEPPDQNRPGDGQEHGDDEERDEATDPTTFGAEVGREQARFARAADIAGR